MEAIQFLEKNKYGNLSTCVDGKPDTRPFEFVFYSERGMFFYTSVDKDVYNQLTLNPYICFCATDENYNYVKVKGTIQFSDEFNDREKIINTSQFAGKIFNTPNNDKLKVFLLPHGECLFHLFQQNNIITETF